MHFVFLTLRSPIADDLVGTNTRRWAGVRPVQLAILGEHERFGQSLGNRLTAAALGGDILTRGRVRYPSTSFVPSSSGASPGGALTSGAAAEPSPGTAAGASTSRASPP